MLDEIARVKPRRDDNEFQLHAAKQCIIENTKTRIISLNNYAKKHHTIYEA